DWWASRRTTSVTLMGFLAIVFFLPLVQGDQGVARVDDVALVHVDGGHGAVLGGDDLVLHLHGLQDHQGVAGLDGSAGLDLDVQDVAGHGRLDRHGAGGAGGGLGRSRGSGGGRGLRLGRGSRGRGGGSGGHRGGAGRGLLHADAVGDAIDGNGIVLHG